MLLDSFSILNQAKFHLSPLTNSAQNLAHEFIAGGQAMMLAPRPGPAPAQIGTMTVAEMRERAEKIVNNLYEILKANIIAETNIPADQKVGFLLQIQKESQQLSQRATSGYAIPGDVTLDMIAAEERQFLTPIERAFLEQNSKPDAARMTNALWIAADLGGFGAVTHPLIDKNTGKTGALVKVDQATADPNSQKHIFLPGTFGNENAHLKQIQHGVMEPSDNLSQAAFVQHYLMIEGQSFADDFIWKARAGQWDLIQAIAQNKLFGHGGMAAAFLEEINKDPSATRAIAAGRPVSEEVLQRAGLAAWKEFYDPSSPVYHVYLQYAQRSWEARDIRARTGHSPKWGNDDLPDSFFVTLGVPENRIPDFRKLARPSGNIAAWFHEEKSRIIVPQLPVGPYRTAMMDQRVIGRHVNLGSQSLAA